MYPSNNFIGHFYILFPNILIAYEISPGLELFGMTDNIFKRIKPDSPPLARQFSQTHLSGLLLTLIHDASFVFPSTTLCPVGLHSGCTFSLWS